MDMGTSNRVAGLALAAVREYEAGCNDRRRVESDRIFGHPGAFIPGCAPTEEGRIEAVAAVLRSETGDLSLLRERHEGAYREWWHQRSLSNAVQRDRAREALRAVGVDPEPLERAIVDDESRRES